MKRQLLGIVLLAIAAEGCGGGVADKPKVAPTAGVVKYKGSPVPDASVVFYPEKGPAGVGKTDSKGAFQIKTNGQLGAAIGKNKVTVGTTQQSAEPPPADGNEMALLQKQSSVPRKYADQTTTDLIVDVPAEGHKDLVLDLTD